MYHGYFSWIYIYIMIYFQRSKHQMMKAGTPANLDNTNMTNTMGTALIYPHGISLRREHFLPKQCQSRVQQEL